MKDQAHLRKLPGQFYTRPTLTVARDLVGRYLCRRFRNEILVGRIVEVEAYLGSRDPASHAYRGRTKRNEVMFETGGLLYVYFTYGIHFCANVVTEGEGTAGAVLLRALEPMKGLETMENNRFEKGQIVTHSQRTRKLCNGPANLCKAFSITRRNNGTPLLGSEIWLAKGSLNGEAIAASTRVGIRKGTSSRWRFFLKGNPFVSPGRPS